MKQRIVTQRACEVCSGSGLVNQSRSGRTLKQPIKCYACGGFLPWENWGRFWQSNMNVGNGGVLQRPASDYAELNEVCAIRVVCCLHVKPLLLPNDIQHIQ